LHPRISWASTLRERRYAVHSRNASPVVDRAGVSGDANHGLASSESIKSPRPRRKYLRGLLGLLLLAVAVPLWLNGPGLRWLAPKIASHFLEKAGLEGEFTLEGSLTGGLTVRDLKLESGGTLATLTLSRGRPIYRIRELLAGRLDGFEIDGLHIDLQLGLEKPGQEAKKPFDPEALVSSLRQWRGRVVPSSIELENVTLRASRDGAMVIDIASSSLQHAAQDTVFQLDLGKVTTGNGKVWPPQQTRIVWNPESLTLDRLDPWPDVGLRAVTLSLPESGPPAADAELHLMDAVFMLNAAPGFGSLAADLLEGRLASRRIEETFGLKLPVAAEMSSLSLNIEGLMPDPAQATAAARVLLENVSYADWSVLELSLDAALSDERATLAASGRTSGTEFSIDAEAPVARIDGEFDVSQVSGKFNVADVPGLLAYLSPRYKAVVSAASAPQSAVNGTFELALDKGRITAAETSLQLEPALKEEAAALAITARWQPESGIAATLTTEGARINADYRIAQSAYQGQADFDQFQSPRIARWLAVVGAEIGSEVLLTGNWQGSGDHADSIHRGSFVVGDLQFTRGEAQTIDAAGTITYDWPAGFSTEGLVVRSGNQTIAADAVLADDLLELGDLRWRENDEDLLTANAKLPVTRDFAGWRDWMSEEDRPLQLDVQSPALPLDRLKEWIPAAAGIDARSTGKVDIRISGTYADPSIAAQLEIRDLRSSKPSELPPADIDLKLRTLDDMLSLEGSIIVPKYPAAGLTASMPFHPAKWIEDPESLRAEPITARADLPRLDLANFAPLVPGVAKLTGVLTGNAELAGEVAKPRINGRLDVSNVGLVLDNPELPPVTGGSAALDLTPERVTLRDLRATMAGGTLNGSGTLDIVAGRPGGIDLRVRGNQLPLLRNDSMIVRADGDLRLTGEIPQAAVTGNVAIVNSLFYRDIEILPIGAPFATASAASLPRIDAPVAAGSRLPMPLRDWSLDVRVVTGNPFLIRGNFAEGSVTANVRLGGTLGKPAPDGEVTIHDLKAALPFSTLNVRQGSLRFTPASGFDPLVEIRATSDPRPYRVNGYVHGRASDPQLVLTSSPPLPENEIMTLLATGTTTSGLENPSAASARALQLFAEELRRGRFAVGRQLRPLLGLLDRVDFTLAEADPYTDESFSTATLSLTDRWYLSAGMSDDGDTRVLGIWRLTFY
jgi:autotransporter translocation and assembly factor TamB